jgi:DNA polymerase delta subunit 4
MPATRRSRTSSGPAAKGAQKTLSFGNKVTKPTSTTSKDAKSPLSISHKSLDVGHVTSEVAVVQQAAIEVSRVEAQEDVSPEEEKAGKVTEAQIKKYWKERERERRAPRVHQEGLTVEEKVLRLFDMSSQYGVCHILSFLFWI